MADIKKELNDIKNAVYGKEVRGSIHDGIKKINDEVENATDLSESAKHQVENIQQQVNQLVVEGDSSVEAAQARVDAEGKSYPTLKARLDAKETEFSSRLAQTHEDLEVRGYDLRWNSLLVKNGDWTEALQVALDNSPDEGRIILLPKNVKFAGTVVFPTVKNSETIIKPIIIKGFSENNSAGALGGYSEGITAIDFVGEGVLFDLTNNGRKDTRFNGGFINLTMYGDHKSETCAIKANRISGAILDNLIIQKFDIGIDVDGEVYYSKIRTVKCLYNKVGMRIQGAVNGTSFEGGCTFSNNENGLMISYGGVAVNLGDSWFEGNTTALLYTETQHANIIGGYFEKNKVTIQATPNSASGSFNVTFIGTHMTINNDATAPIRVTGNVNITMIGGNVVWLLPTTEAFVRYFTGRSGVPSLTLLGTYFTNKPTNLMSQGKVIMDVTSEGAMFSENINLINAAITWGRDNTNSRARIADFPHINTADGNVSMFYNTNTTGSLIFDIHRGDGTAAYAHRFNAKTGDLFMRGGLGVGNTKPGDVTNTQKLRKMEVFDAFGASLGYIQIYSG